MTVKNDLSKQLAKYKTDKLQEVKFTVIDFAKDVEISATRDAPFFISLNTTATEGMQGYEMEVKAIANGDDASPLPAYFEFGTGLSAVQILAPYPQWVKDVAMDFYVDGSGKLKGQPYLFSNLLRLEPEFIRKMRTLLKNK